MDKKMKLRFAAIARLIVSVAAAVTLAAGCKAQGSRAQTKSQSAAAVESVSVTVESPARKTVKGGLILNGTVRSAAEVNVVAETSGKVVKVFSNVGSRVSAGDVLVQIDDELKLAMYKTAQASYEKSKSDYEKAQSLFAQKVISDSDLQGLRLAFTKSESDLLGARRDYENARVRAPQSGIITSRAVTAGTMLSPGATVAHIVDGDNLKLSVSVGERDVLKIRTGMNATIESDMYPGRSFAGRVSSVSPKGDSALTFPVEIAFKIPNGNPLYDGMSARASIDTGEKTILAVPRSALVGSRDSPQLFTVRDGIARLTGVSTGGEYGTDIEILGGVSENDRVVTGGQNNLADGSSVAETTGAVQ